MTWGKIKNNFFSRQCRLNNGNRILVTWIPEKFAIKGKILRLKNRDTGFWENGWEVVDIGARLSYDIVCERSLDYKKMREVTDA